jgi:hypothetical protein
LALTHTHYRDYRDLRGDGRIVLYKRADHQNPKWTARLKVPNVPGFVVKSCKTSDDFEARRFAEDLYYELEGRARRGEPIKAPSFRRVFELWSRSQLVEQHVAEVDCILSEPMIISSVGEPRRREPVDHCSISENRKIE